MRKDNSLFYSFSSPFKQELVIISLLLCILIIFRLEAILNLSNYYMGSVQGDAGIYLWLLKTNVRDLFSGGWFEKPAFYPYGKVLAWSDNFILPALLAKPLFFLGLSNQAVFNLTILSATFLNGYLTYRLSFKLGGETYASFFAGATLMTLPHFTHQLGHPQMLFFFFVPLSLILLVTFINSPSLASSLKFLAIIFLSFLTTVSISVFTATVSLIFLGCVILLRPRIISLAHLRLLLIALSITLIFLTPFALPYIQVRNAFGDRQLYEAYYFSADIFSYLSSTPFNLLYGSSESLSHSEAHLFPGLAIPILSIMALSRLTEAKQLKNQITFLWLTLLCACGLSVISNSNFLKVVVSLLLWLSLILGLRLIYVLGKLERKLKVQAITARDLIAIFSVLSLIFFIITLGPVGNPEKSQPAIAPYTFFYYLFPGFSSIRAVGRAGAIVIFALILCSSIYLSIIYKKRAMRGIAYMVLLFCLLENFNLQYPLSALPLRPDNVEILSKQSEGAAIFLPLAGELDKNNEVASWSEYAERNMTYLLWSVDTARPLVNGYSGQKTKIMREFPRELKDFPSQRALNALGSISGLKYVFYAPQFDKKFNQQEFETKITVFSTQIKLISKDKDGTYLLQINPELQNTQNRAILIPQGGYKISFDVRSSFNTGAGTIKINEFEIPGDGSWRTLEKDLPNSSDLVRPRQISIASEDHAVAVRNIKLIK